MLPRQEKAPIDHVICNSKCLDLNVSCAFDHMAPISDHHPCVGSFHMHANKGSLPSWRWPKPMHIDHIDTDTPWEFQGESHTEWAEKAAAWLATAANTSRVSKVSITSAFPKALSLLPSPEYKRLRKLRSYLARLEKSFTTDMWDKLCITLASCQSHVPTDLEEAVKCVNDLATEHYNRLQEQALSAWRAKVKTWHRQSRELYHYLKNPFPNKCSVLALSDSDFTTDPIRIEACLEEYWGSLETWPHPLAFDAALFVIEDVYSLFLPHVPFSASVSLETIKAQLGRMKKTAAGPDGWTRQELRALPDQAWVDLIYILSSRPQSFSDTCLALYKRVPVLKNLSSPPSPDNFRPIDVFSLVLRLITSAQVAAIRPWLSKVLRRSQFASDRGAVSAKCTIECHC